MAAIFLTAALLLIGYMCCMFIVGLKAQDNSLVDIAYGPAFLFACWGTWFFRGELIPHFRPLLLLFLLTLWGLRLGLHIGLRHRGQGEDFRYRKFRKDWGDTIIWRSFLQIYMLQGAVVLVVATPILLTMGAPGGALAWSDLLGILLFSLGFFFEAISDWQLTVFKRGGANKGKIIMHGLWRYSRHPNYFGEATLWWGIFLIGLAGPYGLYGLISPLTIAFLLLKVSGIPMLEVKYQGNPEFEAYKARTNAFFPWFERKTRYSGYHLRRDRSNNGTTQRQQGKAKVAVIGGGVAGIVAAHLLQKTHQVTLFEQGDYLGGHTHTIAIPEGPDAGTMVDTGFIVFNEATYPYNRWRLLSEQN